MKRILIANRGEIASRIIKTCKKMGIESIAVYSEADEGLPFVKEADFAVCIGKGPVKSSYLQEESILEAALEYRADAIHPGYGFLSENFAFAKKAIESRLIFIGPDPDTIRMMGDKVSARKIMRKAGIPVVAGSDELLSFEKAALAAEEIGYPVLLKASGGGGGIGMAVCRDSISLEKSFESIRARSKAYFRSDKIFLEKFFENIRHIEVQIFADQAGNTVHLFERDCSVQRRNQKLIEEAPAQRISEKTKQKLYEAAILAAKAVQYKGAGTVEFIMDSDENFYFLEMNTRLQVEHPVTERLTGIDLVEWQIEAARGKSLPKSQDEIIRKGKSMEFRLYAEDPKTFYPSPGKISRLVWGNGDNVRIDSGYEEGNTVTPFYDPLIAKIIFYGQTREDCITQASKFFKTTKVKGIKTNIPLFQRILDNDSFCRGEYFTNFIQNLGGRNHE